MTTVITGENIEKFRLKSIFYALRLETKGLKGRFSASVAARKILSDAGIKPERNKLKLLEQYAEYLKGVFNA